MASALVGRSGVDTAVLLGRLGSVTPGTAIVGEWDPAESRVVRLRAALDGDWLITGWVRLGDEPLDPGLQYTALSIGLLRICVAASSGAARLTIACDRSSPSMGIAPIEQGIWAHVGAGIMEGKALVYCNGVPDIIASPVGWSLDGRGGAHSEHPGLRMGLESPSGRPFPGRLVGWDLRRGRDALAAVAAAASGLLGVTGGLTGVPAGVTPPWGDALDIGSGGGGGGGGGAARDGSTPPVLAPVARLGKGGEPPSWWRARGGGSSGGGRGGTGGGGRGGGSSTDGDSYRARGRGGTRGRGGSTRGWTRGRGGSTRGGTRGRGTSGRGGTTRGRGRGGSLGAGSEPAGRLPM